jgi:demethylmenaquinone methyltransferase/2-methoxy-6-polyprenyl-1,4-benzoquinol methylase
MTKTSAQKKIIGLDYFGWNARSWKEENSRQNLQNTIEMVLGDSENMPFPDIILDAITVSFELEILKH